MPIRLEKKLDFSARRTKLCGAVTIAGCDPTVRLLGVSSLNLGRGNPAAHFFAPALKVKFAVLIDQHVGLDIGQCGDVAVDRREIGACRVEQLPEIVDNEIGLLEGVDAVTRAHDPSQLETDPIWPWVFE